MTDYKLWIKPDSPTGTPGDEYRFTDVDPAPPPPPPVEYTLTLDGIELGEYTAGTPVALIAGTPPAGEEFASFSLVSGLGAFTSSQIISPSEWITGAADTVLQTNYAVVTPPPPPPNPGELHPAIQAMPAGSWLQIPISPGTWSSPAWNVDIPPSPFPDGTFPTNFGTAEYDAANGTVKYVFDNAGGGNLKSVWFAYSGMSGPVNFNGEPSTIIMGGGHGDSAFTAPVRFSLQSLGYSVVIPHEDVPEGTPHHPVSKVPQSSHTYQTLQIVYRNGRPYLAAGSGSLWRYHGGYDGSISFLDLETGTWDYRNIPDPHLPAMSVTAVDANGDYWASHHKSAQIARLDMGDPTRFDDDTWQNHSSGGWADPHDCAEIHLGTNTFVRTGLGLLWTYDLNDPATPRTVRTPSGDLEPINADGPGMTYRDDGLIYMHATGGDYFTMDGAYNVTRHSVATYNTFDPSAGPYDPVVNPLVPTTNDPGPHSLRGSGGAFGKFRHVGAGVFLLVAFDSVWILKV